MRSDWAEGMVAPCPSLLPRYLFNTQEPHILPNDLLWGKLEGKRGALSLPEGSVQGRVGWKALTWGY